MSSDPRRKVLIGFLVAGVFCPLSCCGIGYFFFQNLFGHSAASLKAEETEARKQGIPLEPEDLRAKPSPPESENAAPIYRVFFAHIDHVSAGHKAIAAACGDLAKGTATPKQIADIRKTLEECNESLTEISAASKRPYCDFRYAFEKGPDLLLPEFAQGKKAARLMVAKAFLTARAGDVAGAYDWLASASRLGRHLGTTPILIASLVEISIDTMIMREFSDLLQFSAGNRLLLDKAQKTLDSFGPTPSLRQALKGESVMGRMAIRSLKTVGDIAALSQDSEGTGAGSAGKGPKIPQTVIDAYQAKYLSIWLDIDSRLPRDPADWRGAYRVMQNVDRRVDQDKSVTGTLNAILFPVMSGSALAVGHDMADHNIAATAIRLMDQRLKTGSYPSKLPPFGRTSIDPFDGQPLRYRRSGTGFILYSIDRDMRDDGGKERSGSGPGDLVRSFH